MHPNLRMKDWMEAATAEEQRTLAVAAGTSRRYLYRLAEGVRVASADLAGSIEQAAEPMRKVSKGRLPRLLRTDLCPACAGCPFAEKCLNRKVLIGEYDVLVWNQPKGDE